jgi:hypothetical protein
MRTSTGIVLLAPTGRIARSSIARKQLHLERERHVADLVEEKRPRFGGLEQAPAILRRAGKSAFPVSEQLGLEQALPESRRS